MLEFNSGERWWPGTCSRCSVQKAHLLLAMQPKPSTKSRSSMCMCKLSRRPKNSSSPGNWVSLQADWGEGSTVVEVSLQRQATRSWVQIEDFWPLGPGVGFSRGPRKWNSEKQMEIVVVAPPYYIWNCDCYFSKCLLENIQASACHWGLKAPIWM